MKPILMLYANVKFDLDDFLIALCGMMGSAAFCMMMFVVCTDNRLYRNEFMAIK